MENRISIVSYSDYEKTVESMGESDRRIFQFLKSFGTTGDELPSLNELVEPVGPVGVDTYPEGWHGSAGTYAYLATMKSLTGSAYDSKYEIPK